MATRGLDKTQRVTGEFDGDFRQVRNRIATQFEILEKHQQGSHEEDACGNRGVPFFTDSHAAGKERNERDEYNRAKNRPADL